MKTAMFVGAWSALYRQTSESSGVQLYPHTDEQLGVRTSVQTLLSLISVMSSSSFDCTSEIIECLTPVV